jgi:hypothetical protein
LDSERFGSEEDVNSTYDSIELHSAFIFVPARARIVELRILKSLPVFVQECSKALERVLQMVLLPLRLKAAREEQLA